MLCFALLGVQSFPPEEGFSFLTPKFAKNILSILNNWPSCKRDSTSQPEQWRSWSLECQQWDLRDRCFACCGCQLKCDQFQWAFQWVFFRTLKLSQSLCFSWICFLLPKFLRVFVHLKQLGRQPPLAPGFLLSGPRVPCTPFPLPGFVCTSTFLGWGSTTMNNFCLALLQLSHCILDKFSSKAHHNPKEANLQQLLQDPSTLHGQYSSGTSGLLVGQSLKVSGTFVASSSSQNRAYLPHIVHLYCPPAWRKGYQCWSGSSQSNPPECWIHLPVAWTRPSSRTARVTNRTNGDFSSLYMFYSYLLKRQKITQVNLLVGWWCCCWLVRISRWSTMEPWCIESLQQNQQRYSAWTLGYNK